MIICRVILHVIYWLIWLICIDLFEILLKQCLFTSQSCFNNYSFLLIGLLRLYLSQRTDPRDRHFCVVPASWCKRCKRFSDLFEHRKVPKSQESLPATTHTRQTNTRTQMINIDIPWISMILRTSHKSVLLLWSTLYVSALSSCYFEVVVQESRAFCQVSAMAKDPTACSAVDLSTMVYQQNPDGNVHCHKEWQS
jgi:hypothetical protein